MKCTECKYSVEEDHGYVNYTVERADIDCLLDKNPRFPTDRLYGEEPALKYAEECDSFIKGANTQFDVEREDVDYESYNDDPEIIELLKEKYI